MELDEYRVLFVKILPLASVTYNILMTYDYAFSKNTFKINFIRALKEKCVVMAIVSSLMPP